MMVTRRMIWCLLLAATIESLTAASGKIKFAGFIAAGAAGIVGLWKLNGYMQRRKLQWAAEQIQQDLLEIEQRYAKSLQILKESPESSALEFLEQFVQQLKTNDMHHYYLMLTEQIATLEQHIHVMIQKESWIDSNDVSMQALLRNGNAAFADLSKFLKFLKDHTDFFSHHLYHEYVTLAKSHDWVTQVSSAHQQLFEIVASSKESQEVSDDLLHQFATQVRAYSLAERAELIKQCESHVQATQAEIAYLTKNKPKWNPDSSLYQHALELTTHLEDLEHLFKKILVILTAHADFFSLNELCHTYTKLYAEKMAAQNNASPVHYLIADEYRHSSVMFPYLLYSDKLLEHINALKLALAVVHKHEKPHQKKAYRELTQQASELITLMDSLSHQVVTSTEFQRQKEAYQETVKSAASIEAQKRLASAQEEQNKLEKQRIEVEKARILTMEKANQLQEDQNRFKNRENVLKERLLYECQPQRDILIELRDLLRQISHNPQRAVTDEQIDRIITQLKLVHQRLSAAGVQLPYN